MSWMVVDLMTGEVLGRYETELEAVKKHLTEPVSIQYRPRRKKVKKV